MLREVVLTSLCLSLISGCAMMDTSDNEVGKQSAETPAPDPQVKAAPSQPAIATSPTETQSASSENKNVSGEQIKRIQAHLKKAGFYSGSVDGIGGPVTQSAIRHFQSGCANLTDLITASEPATMPQSSEIGTKAAITKSRRGAMDAVRLIQVRLKDAGFDPGPIDGIEGVRTKSALLVLQSGCLMLANVPMAPFNDARVPRAERAARATEAGMMIQHALNRRSANTTRTMSKNSGREAIKALQTRLREAGFDPGPIDGILGPRTRAAAQNYQRSLR